MNYLLPVNQDSNQGDPASISYYVLLRSFNCMKSVRIRSFSGPCLPAFGLNTEIYSVSLHIQSKCRKYGPEQLRVLTLFTRGLSVIQ